MLDSLLNNSDVVESLTFTGTISVVGAALVLGIFISIIYMFTHKTEGYSSSFIISLIMLPTIIAMIILLVGSNVARAFSLAGAFSLIRFRSAPGDAKDIAYVFFTVAVGLACGMGYIGYAVLFAFILCGVMTILNALKFGSHSPDAMLIKIIVPEDVDYNGLFDDILTEYTGSTNLVRIRTVDFGSLFELTYRINLKNPTQSKALIDKVRCKNGNLNVTLSIDESKDSAVF